MKALTTFNQNSELKKNDLNVLNPVDCCIHCKALGFYLAHFYWYEI